MDKIRVMLGEIMAHLEEREVVQTGELIDMFKLVVKEVNDLDYKTREVNKTRVYQLREEYFVMAGNKPFSGWSESVLELKVAELKQKNLTSDASLRNKKI